jgi:hypothetical protein
MNAHAEPLIEPTTNTESALDRPRSRESPPWGWWEELIALLFSIGSTVAIAWLLLWINNKPLNAWPVPGFSFSAALAILATIARTTAQHAVGSCIGQSKWLRFRKPHRLIDLDLIDDASRGPGGSFKLLCMRPLTAAALGAIITIAGLGFSTTVQNLIVLKPRDVFVDDPSAVLGLTHFYRGQSEIFDYFWDNIIFNLRGM